MSNVRWFRNLCVDPLPVPAPGARHTTSVVTSLLLEAESLGGQPILVVQISFTIDIFPNHRVTRDVNVDYRDEALFDFYCDTTSDEDIAAAFLP